MEPKNRLIKFSLISIALHFIAGTLFFAFSNTKPLPVTIPESYQPLQLSMSSGANSGHSTQIKHAIKESKQTDQQNDNSQELSTNDSIQRPDKPKKRKVLEVVASSGIPKGILFSKKTQLANGKKETGNTKERKPYLTKQTSRSTKAPLNSSLKTPVITKTRGSIDEDFSLATRNAVIRKKLNALITRNFSYPTFARKRGWQGTVKLGLRIEANGKLTQVRIVKTSGYSILDQAALTTLTQTNYIKGIESWLAGNYYDTTLPVKYQLIDG